MVNVVVVDENGVCVLFVIGLLLLFIDCFVCVVVVVFFFLCNLFEIFDFILLNVLNKDDELVEKVEDKVLWVGLSCLLR